MDDGKMIGAREVLALLGICNRTLTRWSEDESLGFPAPVIIRNRRYWSKQDLTDWQLALASGRRRREVRED